MFEYDAPKFFVKGGGAAFSDRQKDVFDQLILAEKETTERQRENKCPLNENEEEEEDLLMETEAVRPPKRQCKRFRGKESIFKVPDVPPLFKPTSMPDFKRNPHRWVRYSLGDVSQDDMSEQSNRAAALSFLREVDERRKKEAEGGGDGDGVADKPIVFRNPKRVYKIPVEKESVSVNPEDEDKPHFVNTKLIMPEYIVGEKRQQKKAKRQAKKETSGDSTSKQTPKEVKLGHLVEDDEIE